jgi:signal transduction histidine kinase/CheY-like chemotaxis protein
MARSASPPPLARTARAWIGRLAPEFAYLAAIFASFLFRESRSPELQQAILWLPSGVAIAGLWQLGMRSAWIVPVAALLIRLYLGYGWISASAAACASTCEAVAGALLLRKLGVEPAFARLRDVLALLLIAVLAPLVGMAVYWTTRTLSAPTMSWTLVVGWNGWWRMNLLGILVVVPLIGTWRATWHDPWNARNTIQGCALGLAILASIAGVCEFMEPGAIGIIALYLAVPLSLFAALRFGPLGAASTAALTALAIAVSTSLARGPFVAVPLPERHVALQLFALSAVSVPLLFGALIAERRALEEHLRQAHKLEAVGRLASGVAHDFNNLLTAIRGYSELVLDALPSGASARHDTQQILKATTRAADLTHHLLAYSRQQALSPAVHDLGEIVEQLGDMLRRLISERIELRIRVPRERLHVRVDRSQIEQVVLNLVLNARDAVRETGAISIEVDAEGQAHELRAPLPGERARLRVRDDGCGMDEQTLARVFDPFFTTKERGKGTGLGLSMVQGIVHQSGGEVRLESRRGKGTCATVLLPVAPASQREREPAAPPVDPRRHGTILVAEDDPAVREVMRLMLESAGYRVVIAVDGAEALELVRARMHSLDLVISDVVMPRLGGRELSRALREERPELPLLLVSGYADPDAGKREPISEPLLSKPFSRADLLARVRLLLARG